MKWFGFLLAFISTAYAHEMVPTYPKLVPSHVPGVHKASLEMFNKRADVQFYEIGVFEEGWAPVPFVSAYTLIKLDYLGKVKVDVYIRDEDVRKATYVCSQSKLRNDSSKSTVVASRICSKLKT